MEGRALLLCRKKIKFQIRHIRCQGQVRRVLRALVALALTEKRRRLENKHALYQFVIFSSEDGHLSTIMGFRGGIGAKSSQLHFYNQSCLTPKKAF